MQMLDVGSTMKVRATNNYFITPRKYEPLLKEYGD